MIKITGETPEFKRIITGWHSFDYAFADNLGVGFPLGQLLLVYGPSGSGKTTTVHAISAMLAKETKSNITIAEFERINQDLMIANLSAQGFDGEVNRIMEKKAEETLKLLLKKVSGKEYSVGIVDSVGSISVVSEMQGDLGDANIGKTAIVMGQFARRANNIVLNHDEKTIIIISHEHPRVGSIGTTVSGGVTKNFISTIHLKIQKLYEKNGKAVFKDGSYVIKGQVTKNRWGVENRVFYLFVLFGTGIHHGLTAMYDAIKYKQASVERNVVSIGDISYGNIAKIIEKARDGDNEYFAPFYDVLSKEKDVEIEEEQEEQEDE